MTKKLFGSTILVLFFSVPGMAERFITCNSKDTIIGKVSSITYSLDNHTISVKQANEPYWTNIFGTGTACGRHSSSYVCEHIAFDNLDDMAYPNKTAYDSISCTRGQAGAVSNGRLEVRFYNKTGLFWCSIYGHRVYNLDLSDCVVQTKPN